VHALAEAFHDLFRGLERAYGVYSVGRRSASKNKVGGKARTLMGDVTDALWSMHLVGEQGLGIVPIDDDGECHFGAIDIDVYDGLDLDRLEKQVLDLGLPLVVCRTKSGGAHLYLFCSPPAPANIVRGKLMEWAVVLGHAGVEVFPKQTTLASKDDVGNWINMPYFAGGDTDRYAVAKGKSLGPKDFLALAKSRRTTATKIKKIKPATDEVLSDGPPCLQVLALRGFPEGSRNKALFNLGVLAKKKWPDEWKQKLEEMNRAYMEPPVTSSEMQTIIGSLAKKDYGFMCDQSPIVDACNRQICLTRPHGIAGALDDPGVVLANLTKIETKPPTWIVDVDGVRVEIQSTFDLISQDRFHVLCMETLNRLPNKIKNATWRLAIQDLLETVDVVEAPDDAGIEGQFMQFVEQFCTERGMAKSQDELIVGKPWLNKGRVYFRSTDLLRFLEQNRFRITSKSAWAALRRRDAAHHQFQLKGKCVRCWSVPDFDRQDEGFDVPRPFDNEEM